MIHQQMLLLVGSLRRCLHCRTAQVRFPRPHVRCWHPAARVAYDPCETAAVSWEEAGADAVQDSALGFHPSRYLHHWDHLVVTRLPPHWSLPRRLHQASCHCRASPLPRQTLGTETCSRYDLPTQTSSFSEQAIDNPHKANAPQHMMVQYAYEA